MFLKVVNDVNDLLFNAIKAIVACLGFYATYDLFFNLNIPFFFILLITIIVFSISYLASNEKGKVKAVPLMMVEGGSPADVSVLGGGV